MFFGHSCEVCLEGSALAVLLPQEANELFFKKALELAKIVIEEDVPVDGLRRRKERSKFLRSPLVNVRQNKEDDGQQSPVIMQESLR